MSLFLKVDTYRRLGLVNIVQVAWYTFRLKIGWFSRTLKIKPPVTGVFFEPISLLELSALSDKYTEITLHNEPQVFGWINIDTDSPPDWNKSVLTGKTLDKNHNHWSQISDFSSGIGDIKGLWELSRLSWTLFFVQYYIQQKQPHFLHDLNEWLVDWSHNNPANRGANWKCAQEASLRILHLAACARLLGQKKPTLSLALFITEHMQRIFPTLGYAKAQDNNHGTSEAAALFIGGSWLLEIDPSSSDAQKWQSYGKRYLSERINKLIMPDGSFSQYSVTYHRLMLDTLNLVELWRVFLSLPVFSNDIIQKVQKATFWLHNLIDKHNGDAPNLGANDGAHILNYANVSYRDFRPTVELAYQLFQGGSAFADEGSCFVTQLFELKGKQQVKLQSSVCFPDGGYGVLRNDDIWCLLRVPIFQFRPGQADCLHLDVWLKGLNLLCDAGSYSYNTEQRWLNYFSGGQGHNTVQFDDRQPMPKVSRFLYGKWAKFSFFDVKPKFMQVGYTDWKHANHERQIELCDDKLIIIDVLSGEFGEACLRWRLADLNWQINGRTLKANQILLSVFSTEDLDSVNLVQGFDSRYYGQKKSISVLEVVVSKQAKIITTIGWQ